MSAVLTRSLDLEKTIDTVARLVTPTLADWCLIDIIGASGEIERIGAAHRSPEGEAILRAYLGDYPPNWTQSTLPVTVMKTRRLEVAPVMTAETVRAHIGDERQWTRLMALEPRSVACLPLAARQRVFGAMTFVRSDPSRPFSDADLPLLEELAGRAALALDNARLYREAQDASRLRDDFLATLSHELRTPLNSMVGWLEVLLTAGADEQKFRRAVDAIRRNVQSQAQVISDILDVSRIITGGLRLHVRPVDVGLLARDSLEALRPAAEARRIALELAIAEPLGLTLADPDRLRQVLWNVITNAVKFTGEGGRIEVRVRSDDYVWIEVQDNGAGIPPEFLPYVFDRFRQADSSPGRTHPGLGLGLAIVRHLVELHGGTVRASSAGLGTGSTFTISLPIAAPVEKAPAGSILLDERAPAADALRGARVLVVDDDLDSRELLGGGFEGCGAEIRAASSAAAALAVLDEWWPDVVVADLAMPGEDGYSLLGRIRLLETRQRRRVPIVACSARATDTDRNRALSAGFDAFVAKPVAPSAVIREVATLIRPEAV